MTPTEVRALSQPELDAFYGTLEATALPAGRFTGEAWSLTGFPLYAMGWFWQGKVFQGDRVRNMVRGRQAITGRVDLRGGEIVITYPTLRLNDYLKPGGDGWFLGYMPLFPHVVHFLLRQEL